MGFFVLKNRMLRLAGTIAVTLVALSCFSDDAFSKVRRPAPDRYASIVIDAYSGRVLSERNADKLLYPASLTKMMTLYLVFDALESGALAKNQRIPVSFRAARQQPSRLGLEPGATIRVEDAILGLVTKSANDAAVTLAEALAGSEGRFADMMTIKARRLGMTRTRFVNASGLHHHMQISTARDMATLSRALIRDFPRYYGYFSVNDFTWAGITNKNHNKLMNTYTGMDGIKTGYVHASGYNLAASAARGNKRLIGVIFGGRTSKTRNQEMARLLDAGFGYSLSPQIAQARPAYDVVLPVRKPQTASAIELAAYEPSAAPEQEGDAGDEDALSSTRLATLVRAFQPKSLNTDAVTGNGEKNWAVQVGAFSSHDASLIALRSAKSQLPGHVAASGQETVAPLMTSRGVIYRARLANLSQAQATRACRLLQDNCLVLAAQ